MTKVNLDINKNKYSVYIGYNIDKTLTSQVKRVVKNNRLFIIYDANLYALYNKKLSKFFNKNKTVEFVIPPGESSKTSNELNKLYAFFIENNISRSDLILSVGGGMVSDLVGYAAATTMRGIPFAVVSTSLLCMVDASIGGKTGINHPKGKNLIGTFYHPKFVISDLAYLSTLPEREFISGFGEILKYTGLIGNNMIDIMNNYLNGLNLFNHKALLRIIIKSVEYKKKIVELDEREEGKRMVLNLGHTFGHAIELSLGFKKLLHGEALILGLISAVYLSRTLKPKNDLTEYNNILKRFLNTIPKVSLNKNRIIESLSIDKKRRNSSLNFILLDRLGKPIIRSDIRKKMIEKSIDYMIDCYKKLRY